LTDSNREYEFEKIENVPKTVRELLTEMKDISEVIVDLAYASLMFDSREIREEVKHLESNMDTMNYEIRIKAMLASRTPEDAIQLSGLLQVASAAEAISNAAGERGLSSHSCSGTPRRRSGCSPSPRGRTWSTGPSMP